jgi:putative ABC transport system permease protein
VATALGWIRAPAVGGFTMQIFGALIVVLGLGMALRRRIGRKRLYPRLAGILTAYYAFTYFLISEFDDLNEANLVGPMRGVILTLSVVVIVIHWEALPRMLGRLLAKAKRLRAVALPAVSYPQHKRFRTGMTLAMFSIVILSIGFFSIFGALFERPVESQTGGFQVEATTTLDVPDLLEYDRGLITPGTITNQAEIRYFRTVDVELITVSGEKTGHFGPPRHIVFGIGQDFVDAQEFRLLWRDDAYDSDNAAYQAVLESDDVVVVSYQYSTDEQGRDLSHEVGESLQLNVGDEPKEFTIIGIQEQYHLPGIFLPKQMVEDLFPTADNNFYLYKLADGVDHEETAKLLERNYRDVGMDAEASEILVAEEQEAFRQILGAMKLFLGLGLIVGVLSLGIVTARSVIERRQEIGMLRALGYTGNMIRRIFIIEMTYTVALGAIIGVACSILVSFGLWFAIIRDLQYPYVIPWGEIFILLLISYVVALLATFGPIRRASKVAPAEALRYIE